MPEDLFSSGRRLIAATASAAAMAAVLGCSPRESQAPPAASPATVAAPAAGEPGRSEAAPVPLVAGGKGAPADAGPAVPGAEDAAMPPSRVVVVPTSRPSAPTPRPASATAAGAARPPATAAAVTPAGHPAKPAPKPGAAATAAKPAPHAAPTTRSGTGAVAWGGNVDPQLAPVDHHQHAAVGATVTVSSTHKGATGETPPAALVDGDPATRWSSGFADGQWVVLDLGRPIAIDRVRLLWELAAASSFALATSDDGAHWHEVLRRDGGTAGPRVDDLALSPVTTRWLRLDLLVRATAWGFSLFEIEVQPTR